MSFDILFASCNMGTLKKRAKHPFTGKKITVFDDPGPTAAERAAVIALLNSSKGQGPDEFGAYEISFSDGGEADVLISGSRPSSKARGLSIGTCRISKELCNLMFAVSQAGNMYVLAVFEGSMPIVTSERQLRQIVVRHPDAKLVESVADLEKAILRGFAQWQQYRDQVIGDAT